MPYLWDRPKNDSDALMYDRICEFTAYCEATLNEEYERHVGIECALGKVYYDVFNNGGVNLANPINRASAELLAEYAREKSIEVPRIVFHSIDEVCYDCVEPDDVDKFARQIIRHLYLDISEPKQ